LECQAPLLKLSEDVSFLPQVGNACCLEQRGPNTGTRAACGPQTLFACHILHKVINTLY